VLKLITSLAVLAAVTINGQAADAYKWSVQYIIDNSQSVFGHSQEKLPRRNRALALSPDGRYLYAGYTQGSESRFIARKKSVELGDHVGEVRKIAVEVSSFEEATESVLSGPTGKAIATDDKGRVYMADRSGVLVYDADLERQLDHIKAPGCEGIALARDGGKLLMFTSSRADGTITRWLITEDGDGIASVKPNGFDGSGVFRVPGAESLRGLKVDATGNIWVCDYEAGMIFRIRKDGKDLKSTEIGSPMDLAFDGNRVFVTRGPERMITVFDRELVIVGSLNVPWQELALSASGNNQTGALCGIVTVPGRGFYVANEGGQTANQQSIYGKADDFADLVSGEVIRDAKNDDNEPILKATAVSTTAAR
jgi:sugar lactone lactonase YvrE